MVAIMSELLSSDEMKVKYAKSIAQLVVNYQQWLKQGASVTDLNVLYSYITSSFPLLFLFLSNY